MGWAVDSVIPAVTSRQRRVRRRQTSPQKYTPWPRDHNWHRLAIVLNGNSQNELLPAERRRGRVPAFPA